MTSGWAGLVRWLSAGLCAALVAVGLASGDRETLVIAGGLLVATGLSSWRSGLAGTALAGLLAIDIAFWMLPAAITNLVNGEAVAAVVVPSALASGSLVLAVACGFDLLARRRPASRTGKGPLVAIGVGIAAVGVTAVAGLLGATDGPQAGDVEVVAHDAAFEPDHLEVESGPTTFYVSNEDLFWHTFSIRGADVDVRLATRGHRRVSTDLEPGTYEFVCRVPGHESLGMTGTLVVR